MTTVTPEQWQGMRARFLQRFEWTEIIANAKARLQFINASLSYEANRESSKAYLQKAHAKFIPQVSAVGPDDEDEKSEDEEDAV